MKKADIIYRLQSQEAKMPFISFENFRQNIQEKIPEKLGLGAQFNHAAYNAKVHKKYHGKLKMHKTVPLLTASDNLSRFCTHLENQKRNAQGLTHKDLPTEDLLKYLVVVQKNILYYDKALKGSDNQHSVEREYNADLLLMHFQQLEVLFEIAEVIVHQGNNSSFSSNERAKIDSAFKDVIENSVFTEILERNKTILNKAIRTAHIPLSEVEKAEEYAKSLNNVLQQGIKKIGEYEHGKYTPPRLNRGISGFIQEKKTIMTAWIGEKTKRNIRKHQTDLLKKCLDDLSTNTMPIEQKELISKGLLLAIKHQLEQEHFSSGSKLKKIVNAMLEEECFKVDNSRSSVNAFAKYANKYQQTLKIPSDILKKINNTTKDQDWVNTQHHKIFKGAFK